MRHVNASDIRNLRPHIRRGLMDGTLRYKDQQGHVTRGDYDLRHPGQFRDNLIVGTETKHRGKG